MKLWLKDISESENYYKNNYDPSQMNLDIKGLAKINCIKADIKVNCNDNKLDVIVNYIYNGEFKCVRCLEDFKLDIKGNFNMQYNISELQDFLDITDDIRENIILNYPKKPLCKEDCKGLCSVCGNKLNESNCNCNQSGFNNPFSKLVETDIKE